MLSLIRSRSCPIVRSVHSAAAVANDRSKFLLEGAFINGEWRVLSDKFPVPNPATGEVIGHTSNCGQNEINEAISAAKEAFKTWSFTTGKERSALIRKMFELQMKYQRELAEIITIEMGKPINGEWTG